MSDKPKKYQHDGTYTCDGKTVYIRAWKEGKGRNAEIAVQVWLKGKPEGEPEGDWGMPGVLPVTAAIEQAILQTSPNTREAK